MRAKFATSLLQMRAESQEKAGLCGQTTDEFLSFVTFLNKLRGRGHFDLCLLVRHGERVFSKAQREALPVPWRSALAAVSLL